VNPSSSSNCICVIDADIEVEIIPLSANQYLNDENVPEEQKSLEVRFFRCDKGVLAWKNIDQFSNDHV